MAYKLCTVLHWVPVHEPCMRPCRMLPPAALPSPPLPLPLTVSVYGLPGQMAVTAPLSPSTVKDSALHSDAKT